MFMSGFWKRILWRSDSWLGANRATRYREGLCRYGFDDHIVILGGGEMLEELLEAVADRSDWAGKDVVVHSSLPAVQVRARLATRLSPEAGRLSVTVYHGDRTNEAELRSCRVEQASVLFIIGDNDENGHDAQNVQCWERIRSIRVASQQVAQCYLFLNTSATVSLFNMLPQEAHTSVETTIINRFESIVEQLIVGDNPLSAGHTLDRGLVTADADRYVHLVVAGMTEVGYAFATTAARLCHFPNFDETSPHPLRTKITLVDPAADVKMWQFRNTYPHLFALSHSHYMANENGWLQSRPDSSYGDFIDVEWEFVKGTLADDWVRAMLVDYATDPGQVLSVALCSNSADENFSQSLHLPSQLYPMPVDSEEPSENDACQLTASPNIYVYQPNCGILPAMAQKEVVRLHNLIPFGCFGGNYDPLIVRPTAVAKRVNYLLQKENSGKQFVAMPTDAALLDALWQQLSLAEKISNIHTANSVYTTLRGMAMATSEALHPLDDPERLENLCRVEHSRWNVERLLVGYEAMTIAERDRLNSALASSDPDVRQEARTHTNRNTNQLFIFKDIAPYASLSEATKADIRTIARNLPLAALPYITTCDQ